MYQQEKENTGLYTLPVQQYKSYIKNIHTYKYNCQGRQKRTEGRDRVG